MSFASASARARFPPGYLPSSPRARALNLLAAVASVAHEMRAPLVLGIGFVITRTLLAALGIPGMLRVSEGLWVTAIVLATVTSVRHAFRPGVVNAERILAALDAYLLA